MDTNTENMESSGVVTDLCILGFSFAINTVNDAMGLLCLGLSAFYYVLKIRDKLKK